VKKEGVDAAAHAVLTEALTVKREEEEALRLKASERRKKASDKAEETVKAKQIAAGKKTGGGIQYHALRDRLRDGAGAMHPTVLPSS